MTAAASAFIYFQRLCPNLANQPDGPGIQQYFPLQEQFQEPRSESHCQAQQLAQTPPACSLAPLAPFAPFVPFFPFVFSLVSNSQDLAFYNFLLAFS